MNLNTPLPFELGETYKGTDNDGNIVTPDWAGQVFLIGSNNYGAGARTAPRRSGRQLLGVPLLNNSGVTLYGKRLGRLKRGGGVDDLSRVDGYSAAYLEKGIVIIDEFLATNGVADKYYFWGIFQGPVTVLTPFTGAGFGGADIAVGDLLAAATGATTQDTAAGKVVKVEQAILANSLDDFDASVNLVGRALSARTTGETNSDLLIHAMLRY